MKTLFLLTLISVAFVSCDGRKSKSVALKESIEKLKDSAGTLETIKYFPEEYAENVRDSILSNGFRVKIKTYTDLNNSYLHEFEIDSVLNKHYYRNYIAEIEVLKNHRQILKLKVDNSFIVNNDPSSDKYLEDLTMHGVWIDQSKSNDHKNVVIDFLFCKPETDVCFYFEMTIDQEGHYQLKEIKENV